MFREKNCFTWLNWQVFLLLWWSVWFGFDVYYSIVHNQWKDSAVSCILLHEWVKPSLRGDVTSLNNSFQNECVWSSQCFSAAWAAAWKAWKIQAWMGIWTLLFAMPMQCSTSWAIMPTASRLLCGLIMSL